MLQPRGISRDDRTRSHKDKISIYDTAGVVIMVTSEFKWHLEYMIFRPRNSKGATSVKPGTDKVRQELGFQNRCGQRSEVVYNALQLVPSLHVQLVTVVIFAAWRAFLYSSWDFIGHDDVWASWDGVGSVQGPSLIGADDLLKPSLFDFRCMYMCVHIKWRGINRWQRIKNIGMVTGLGGRSAT